MKHSILQIPLLVAASSWSILFAKGGIRGASYITTREKADQASLARRRAERFSIAIPDMRDGGECHAADGPSWPLIRACRFQVRIASNAQDVSPDANSGNRLASSVQCHFYASNLRSFVFEHRFYADRHWIHRNDVTCLLADRGSSGVDDRQGP